MRVIKLYGARGSGKTMVAQRLADIYGRPLRAPHFTASAVALREEVGLAAGGILYLDEVDQMKGSVIDSMLAALAQFERINCRAPTLVVSIDDDRHKDKWPDNFVGIDLDLYDIGAFVTLFDRLAEPLRKGLT